MASKIIGVDPGLDGAVCVLEGGKVVEVYDIPTFEITVGNSQGNGGAAKKRRKIDVQGLFRLFAKHSDADFVLIEQVWAMPKQGVSSSFTFGKTLGSIEACIALSTLPMHSVAPQVWKKELRVTNDKDGARSRAADLFPEAYDFFSRKKDHNRAEAALIAHYGRLKYGLDGSETKPLVTENEHE
jgi:crossover junction endodeoxyribonuclease RuvC